MSTHDARRQPAASTLARRERAARQAAEGAVNTALYEAEMQSAHDRISTLKALRMKREAAQPASPLRRPKRAKAKV